MEVQQIVPTGGHGWRPFVLQVYRLNAKIEKSLGVMHVVDEKYYYVRIQKRPLEAVKAQLIGGITPHVCR